MEKRRLREEQRKREEEEENRKLEEQRRKRREEEEKRQREEEKRIKEEREKRRLEEEKIIEKEMEARRLREEQIKRQEEEENRKRKEKMKKKLEEEKREEEEEKRKREEKKQKILEEEKIFEEFNKIKQNINNYFALLPFYDKINKEYDLSIKINASQKNIINSYEEKLKDYFNSKIKNKYKEWEDQIKRAKWKLPVQAQGKLECKKGCILTDSVICHKCKGNLYWVDSDAKYAICQNCENNGIRKLGNQLLCEGCGAETFCQPKWIIGYKP